MDKEKVIRQYHIPNCQSLCIYALYSDYDGKYFIGLSSNIRQRGLLLIQCLLSGYCTNKKLQTAFSLHPESFRFRILEECTDPLIAYDHANDIVESLDTIRNGYNLIRINKPRQAWGYSQYELSHGIDVSGVNLPAYSGCAVYIITDHLTSRFYIGSTADFVTRIRSHICALRSGYHQNADMQLAFSDHPDHFSFDLLKKCSTEDEARRQEAIEIHTRNAIEKGFNKINNPNLLPVKWQKKKVAYYFFFFAPATERGGVYMGNAQKIRMALAYKKMSESKLAEALGKTPQAFNQRMKTDKFTTEDLTKIAEVLGATYISEFSFPDGTKI